MVVGVNGAGKTTSIGKLTRRLQSEGKSVLLCAADTFRAAAIEQLEVWAQRTGADLIRQQPGADPSAVAFDALQAAKARKVDYVIVDTAGRLHTKTNLMAELEKMRRTAARVIPRRPHEVLLVIEATTGQNGLEQARKFTESSAVTGIILTKLDGTAKGGVVVAISRELNLPIRYVGVGEQLDDLLPFDPAAFVGIAVRLNESASGRGPGSGGARRGTRRRIPPWARWWCGRRGGGPRISHLGRRQARGGAGARRGGRAGARRDAVRDARAVLAPGPYAALRRCDHRGGNPQSGRARCRIRIRRFRGRGFAKLHRKRASKWRSISAYCAREPRRSTKPSCTSCAPAGRW